MTPRPPLFAKEHVILELLSHSATTLGRELWCQVDVRTWPACRAIDDPRQRIQGELGHDVARWLYLEQLP